jgi:hypothetical protein
VNFKEREDLVMKKTLYVLALVLALGAAAFGVFASSPSNVMAKDGSEGVSVGL